MYTNMFVTVSSLYTNNFCTALLLTLQNYMRYFKAMKKELIQIFPLNQFFFVKPLNFVLLAVQTAFHFF
ncbi:hypothetical protein CBR56_24285 [Bacillus thuringiensis]|nr:hypothetical protein BK728_16745 [Bacillus thuringiensis serovar chanpaisis]PNK24307.1 hypothetical protein CBR56_24285 [Bacillus thuringiensis]